MVALELDLVEIGQVVQVGEHSFQTVPDTRNFRSRVQDNLSPLSQVSVHSPRFAFVTRLNLLRGKVLQTLEEPRRFREGLSQLFFVIAEGSTKQVASCNPVVPIDDLLDSEAITLDFDEPVGKSQHRAVCLLVFTLNGIDVHRSCACIAKFFVVDSELRELWQEHSLNFELLRPYINSHRLLVALASFSVDSLHFYYGQRSHKHGKHAGYQRLKLLHYFAPCIFLILEQDRNDRHNYKNDYQRPQECASVFAEHYLPPFLTAKCTMIAFAPCFKSGGISIVNKDELRHRTLARDLGRWGS